MGRRIGLEGMETSPLRESTDRIIIDCPCCGTKVAVPSSARGSMAKCLKCANPFRIPQEDEEQPFDESQADDLVLQVLEDTDDDTVSLKSADESEDDADDDLDDDTTPIPLADDEEEDDFAASLSDAPATTSGKSKLEEVEEMLRAIAEEDPPDIGDASTAEEVKQLRRERHKLLLEIGQGANEEILSKNFEPFQERVKRIVKRLRRVRAWLEAVDRAGSTNNPLARRMDMNVDASKATEQLIQLERERHLVLRAMAEALVASTHNAKVFAEERARVKEVDARIEELIPTQQPKKSLLSRFRKT